MRLVLGTRGSPLARYQAERVRECLLDAGVGTPDELVLETVRTRGDRVRDRAISQVGGRGVFVRELEHALVDGTVDVAVHSLKDLPSAVPEGLELTATPVREDPRDAWIRPRDAEPCEPEALPEGAVVGTSSLRRASQLLARRPDLRLVPIRGNVGTRLDKLDERREGMQALILAAAGLRRLGWDERITRALDPSTYVPSAGQGTIVAQIRADDANAREAFRAVEAADPRDESAAERGFLATVEGGCEVPMGAFARVDGERIELSGFLGQTDGSEHVQDVARGPRDEAAALGRRLAETLLDRGGREILASFRAEIGDGG